MSGELKIECPVCWSPFGSSANIPMIGTCGHSVCNSCAPLLAEERCPTCRKKTRNHFEVKNYQLIQLLEIIPSPRPQREKEYVPWEGCKNCKKRVNENEAHLCLTCFQSKQFTDPTSAVDWIRSNRFCQHCSSTMLIDSHTALPMEQMLIRTKSEQMLNKFKIFKWNYLNVENLAELSKKQEAAENKTIAWKKPATLEDLMRQDAVLDCHLRRLDENYSQLVHPIMLFKRNSENLMKFISENTVPSQQPSPSCPEVSSSSSSTNRPNSKGWLSKFKKSRK